MFLYNFMEGLSKIKDRLAESIIVWSKNFWKVEENDSYIVIDTVKINGVKRRVEREEYILPEDLWNIEE